MCGRCRGDDLQSDLCLAVSAAWESTIRVLVVLFERLRFISVFTPRRMTPPTHKGHLRAAPRAWSQKQESSHLNTGWFLLTQWNKVPPSVPTLRTKPASTLTIVKAQPGREQRAGHQLQEWEVSLASGSSPWIITNNTAKTPKPDVTEGWLMFVGVNTNLSTKYGETREQWRVKTSLLPGDAHFWRPLLDHQHHVTGQESPNVPRQHGGSHLPPLRTTASCLPEDGSGSDHYTLRLPTLFCPLLLDYNPHICTYMELPQLWHPLTETLMNSCSWCMQSCCHRVLCCWILHFCCVFFSSALSI